VGAVADDVLIVVVALVIAGAATIVITGVVVVFATVASAVLAEVTEVTVPEPDGVPHVGAALVLAARNCPVVPIPRRVRTPVAPL
jgi:hypothetical protein